MIRSSARFAVIGLLALGASTAIMVGRAISDDCVHSASCPEEHIDGRGCCRMPASPDTNVDARIGILTGKAATTPTRCPDDMVPVAAAAFLMGSPPGAGDPDEHPQHRVALGGYCIDRTEVTVAAYTRCVASGKCTPAAEPEAAGLGSLCNGKRVDRQGYPINCVNWEQARVYCAAAGKRLPSEAEWEYAARGPDERTYPWGHEAPRAELLNACGADCRTLATRLKFADRRAMYAGDDHWETTAPVGSFRDGASPFGALDMAGNVAEWTEDTYHEDYAGTASHFNDGPHQVVRGGAWNHGVASWVRGASRDSYNPAMRSVNIGFRCARSE
jgi:formylglycine-generating enzyme required for sulfatase activity